MNTLGHLYGRVLSIQDLPGFTCDCKILRVVFSSREQVRSRRVVTRSRYRPTGKYPSWKMGRMLQWESINELNAFRVLDCDPRVTAFTDQPCEIVYLDGSEIKHHYPDVYFEMNGNQELWEIKPKSEASQSEFITRTDVLRRGLFQYGFAYRVVLDHELARQPRLQNAKTLLRFGRCPASEYEREYARNGIRSNHSLPVSACSYRYAAERSVNHRSRRALSRENFTICCKTSPKFHHLRSRDFTFSRLLSVSR